MSYHSNLVVQTLPKHVTMQKIEDLLETLYEYFAIVLSIAKSWQKWPMSWKHEKGGGFEKCEDSVDKHVTICEKSFRLF